MAMVVISCSYG